MLTKQVLAVVHQETSDPGYVGQVLRSRGYALDIRCPAIGQALPASLENHEAVIVFGGPMSANDDNTLPFIRTELDWLPLALASQRPFLGICLGAQLLARVLGAKVAPHEAGMMEIGYFPITPTDAGQSYFNRSMSVYHWHREGFALPADAVLLAQGEAFPNQAYRYGDRAYGVQFHPEMTKDIVDRWTTQGAEMLTLPGAQSRDQQMQGYFLHAHPIHTWVEAFVLQWIEPRELGKDAPLKTGFQG